MRFLPKKTPTKLNKPKAYNHVIRYCKLLHVSVADHSPAQSIPSKKAFLFGLQPFITSHGQKMFPLLPEKRDQAIRGDNNKGPCWGMDTQELCFSSRNVNIDPGGVFDYNGITNSNTYFTGESSFQADDVEVFVFGGRNQLNFFMIN